jgi:pyruvate formate lyase activating enzyme
MDQPVRARFWTAEAAGVHCRLCPVECLIAEGKAGRCLGRRNAGGVLLAESYGRVVSLAVDPIEKKPLYHFLPGSQILSTATYGCNLACPFCQNAEISQSRAGWQYLAPHGLVELARRHGTPSLAFTYSEPGVWFEYVVDSARLARAAGIRTVLVTNGLLADEPRDELLPLIDALNIDLKSIRPDFYRDYVRGDLDSVLATIRSARARCHVELTNLIIPGRNDSEADITALVDFVAGLGADTVLHFSRYFPRHRATEPATPVATLARALEVARRRLRYVYLGNVGGSRGRDTSCPACGRVQVTRGDGNVRVVGVDGGRCTGCGRPADLVLA